MRILIVSDIHGNIEALRAVAAAEPSVDQVLCLGDTVDYGPHPDATVEWVRTHADAGVRGNHDNAAAFSVDCGSAPLFRRLSVETRRRTRTSTPTSSWSDTRTSRSSSSSRGSAS